MMIDNTPVTLMRNLGIIHFTCCYLRKENNQLNTRNDSAAQE